MKKALKKLDLVIGSIALILMVVIVVVQVVARKMGNPFAWPEEVCRWTMIWITFAGASYCFQNGGLIRVEYFVQKFFSQKVQKIINILNMVIFSGFFAFLGYSSIKYMMLTMAKHQVYNVTRVPYSAIIFALSLGSVLCIVFSLSQIIQMACPKDDKAISEKEETK